MYKVRVSRFDTDILVNLISRNTSRYTASEFQKLPYFNNEIVSTLKFLERDSFSGFMRSEKIQFLRGLPKVLPQFSRTLLRRKLLPSVCITRLTMELFEASSDKSLLPYILPTVFYIVKEFSQVEFCKNVLPKLRPLFDVHDPPQCQMILLNQTDLFVSKTTPDQFQLYVMPLFYSAIEQDEIAVQENLLQRIPRITEYLNYSDVKKLMPKLIALFTKTKTLSVKVSALICFHAIIPILDTNTLTETLLPTLARIKTREASVLVASLAVYEALATKLDHNMNATAVLPRLWIMCMSPTLNETQFSRFMQVIKMIGESVEQTRMYSMH